MHCICSGCFVEHAAVVSQAPIAVPKYVSESKVEPASISPAHRQFGLSAASLRRTRDSAAPSVLSKSYAGSVKQDASYISEGGDSMRVLHREVASLTSELQRKDAVIERLQYVPKRLCLH